MTQRVHRKTPGRFPCGHRGLGQWCHRCKQADECERVASSGGSPVGTGMHLANVVTRDMLGHSDFAWEATRLRSAS